METLNGVENLLDHLRIHFEPIEVFRQGRVVDDFVGDFERQPGEEVEEYAPRRNAMPTAVPQARAKTRRCTFAPKTVRSVPSPLGERPGTKEMRKCTSSRKRRLLTSGGRPSTRKQWP